MTVANMKLLDRPECGTVARVLEVLEGRELGLVKMLNAKNGKNVKVTRMLQCPNGEKGEECRECCRMTNTRMPNAERWESQARKVGGPRTRQKLDNSQAAKLASRRERETDETPRSWQAGQLARMRDWK